MSNGSANCLPSTSSNCSFTDSPRDFVPRRRTLFLPSCLARQDSTSASPRRAVTPDSANPLIRSLQSGRSLVLKEEDLELIRTTWHNIPDKLLWCERLFLKLFSIKGQMKKVMGYEGMTPKEMMHCERFEAHCQRFLNFWQRLIDAMCAVDQDRFDQRAEEVVNKIREVGYLHCEIPGVTFDAESWLIFKNIILESVCLKHSKIRDPTHFCWSKFVTFVIAEMKDAFHQGVRSRSHTF